jgi:hypothetical protein
MKRGLSHLFFRVLGYLTDLKLDPAVGNSAFVIDVSLMPSIRYKIGFAGTRVWFGGLDLEAQL